MKVLKAVGFWILSLTWGLPMTLFGAIIAFNLLIEGYKPKRFHQYIYFTFGKGGWGFEAGGFFFLSKDAEDNISLKQHEAGHGLQNIIFGVFMPFIVSIPSAVRFWWRKRLIKSGKKTESDLPPYNSIWFERQATEWGQKHYPKEIDR